MSRQGSDEPAVPPDDACRQASALLAAGAPLPAYDVVSGALRASPGHVRLRQLLALALARSGASRQANGLLQTLRAEGHGDEETLGMLARTHKDLSAAAVDPAEQRLELDRARQCYRDAFAATGGFWTGINVATTALLLGDRGESREVAARVREQCRALLDDPARAHDYWLLATSGEAALLLEDFSDADRWYARAVEAGRDRLGDRVSTRRNARLVLRHLGADVSRFDACFGIPRVVACVGHLIDRRDRPTPRFPPALEPAVRESLRDRLRRLDAGVGFASAACGADLLALECLAERGAATYVVLPYDRERFVADSVDIAVGDWRARFDRALAAATDVMLASEQRMGSGATSYEYAFRLLDGAARVRADELDTDLVCLAVWDGQPGDGAGGTATAVDHWRRHGRTLEVIDLAATLRQADPITIRSDETPGAAVTASASPSSDADQGFDPRVVSMLFADVVGFSHLSDIELPRFVEHYLGLVARELARLPSPPLLANTWGDGVYVVFDDVRYAGLFALRLCEGVRSTDWIGLGFHIALDVRVGLHAGPAYACDDPVLQRRNYMGAHVSRAARIEPITPPGSVYATRAFTALARADNVEEFSCRYVGPMPLAKSYGTYPMYVVTRPGH